MAKNKTSNRSRLNLDDVLAGRGHSPSARELIELIREINPSGLDLPAAHATRRYAQKSRLQSLLIRRFEHEIDVEPDVRDPGVVSLRYRPLDADACHAVLRELDEDARSWAQRQVDLRAFEGGHEQTNRGSSARGAGKRAVASGVGRPAVGPLVAGTELPLAELLRAGTEAIDAYDYELARDLLSRAFELGAGGAEVALPLLSLLVDHLAADQEALLLEARLTPAALKQPQVRRLLALAAARCSEHDRAEYFVQDQRDPDVAEVYLALARAALDAGDLDRAARDLARAREICPTHAMLGGLEAHVSRQRACERRPLEDELAGLVAERRLDEAEAHGRAVLARWPDSASAQRALREIDELRKADRTRSLLGSAEEALARGQAAHARSLMQQAFAIGLHGEEAAVVQKRIGEIEAAERAAAERAQEERVVRLLCESDLTPGLLSYVGLDIPQRSRVRAQVGSVHLEWLDEMGAAGSGARARAAVAAVLALDRAAQIAAEEPEAALELLSAHGKMLQGVRRSDEVVAGVRRRMEALQRANAARRLAAAHAAFDARAIDQAQELLAGVPLGQLSEHHRASAGGLHARIADVLAVRNIDRLFRDGALLRASQAADKLLERLQGADRVTLLAVREKLGDAVRQAFRIRVDHTPRPLRSFNDVDLYSIPGAPRTLLPDTEELVLVETRGVWVFLRLIDLPSRTVRVRATLRTPVPVDLIRIEVDGGRLLVIDQFASILELSLSDWTVVGWHERLCFETEPLPPKVSKATQLPSGRDLAFPLELVRDAALVPGTRMLWLTGSIRARSFARIVDLSRGRVLRELRDSLNDLGVIALHGLDRPTMMLVRQGDDSVALYDPRGSLLEGSKVAWKAFRDGIVVYPQQQKILMFAGNTEKQKADGVPAPVVWSILTPPGSASSQNVLLQDMESAERFAAAVDPATGMVFVRAVTPRGAELIGLRTCGASSPNLDQMFRVSMPDHAAMIQGWDGQGVVLLVGYVDEVAVIRLGENPPTFRPSPRSGEVRPSHLSFWGRRCHRPTGPPAAAAEALHAAMKDEPRHARAARIEQAKGENDVARLFELSHALELCDDPPEAAELAAWLSKHHPDHPATRVNRARPMANSEQWSLVRDVLIGVDPSSLDDGPARHLHHMLGAALLHLGEPDEALRVVKKGALYPQGRCDLTMLVALLTPLPESPDDPDDSEPWDADQVLVRLLMRAIQATDACLERGDAAGAMRFIDRWEVLQASEVQSLARLAEVYLLGEEVAEDERFDKASKLASFCAAHAQKMVLIRRELPLPRNRWDMAKLDDVSVRATQWLDATLGAAWPVPPGGF